MKHLWLSALGLSSCSLFVTLLKPPFDVNFDCGNRRNDDGEICFDVIDTGAVGNFDSVDLGDQDDDGFLDIFTTSSSDLQITITHFNGEQFRDDDASASAGPFSVAIGEFSGDTLADVAFVTQNQVQVFRSIAVDVFSLADSDSVIGSPLAIEAGAFDSEVGDDIVVASAQGDFITLYNTFDVGSLSAGIDFATGDRPVAIAKADFDGDGDTDFVVANQDSQDVSVFINDGANLTPLGEFFIGGTLRDIALGDFNGDGLADVAATDGAVVRVMFQNGAGFDAPVSLEAGIFPSAITAGDFDGDSIQDFAVANLQDDLKDITIFLGDASGVLTSSSLSINQTLPFALASGDINNDSVDDIAVIADGTLTALLSNP